MTVLRHLTQLLVLVLIAVLVLANDYLGLRGQYGGRKVIDENPLYSWVEAEWLGRSPHMVPQEIYAHGSLWSMKIQDFRLSDPLAVMTAPELLWVSALIPIGVALLLGRVFCSWLCPMGLLSDLVTDIRRMLKRIRVEFFAFALSPNLKYVVLAVGVGFYLVASVSLFFPIYPPRILSDLVREALVGKVLLQGPLLIGAILLLELLFVRRLWCRCLCPGSAVYSILGSTRVLRIRRDAQTCTDCKDCDDVCPHELAPSHKALGGECDNCGLCRAACQPRALHYSLGLPAFAKAKGDSNV
jgi:ferredoxin-type protein NapH